MRSYFFFIFFFKSFSYLAISQSILIEYETKRLGDLGYTYNYENVWITDSLTINNNTKSENPASFVKHKLKNRIYEIQTFLIKKKFNVKDSLHTFQWELLPDTATILKYKCLSAKTTFRGRTYKVFYAPTLPISDGPWKLGGLPGLILEAKTTDNYVSWRAIKLDLNYKGKIDYVDVTKENYLTWAEFVKEYKETVTKMTKSMYSSMENMPPDTKINIKLYNIEIIDDKISKEGIWVGK